ncbi:hypothetical protein [Streptomyces sp. ADI98-10]|uniref:hypothetical protein n=1 Tax=Streptomyces sp. ADI98-10 TaxID=1522763 RepID=UPI000FA9685F|nr:hypothetical protein [Streptomyces sp. ADI98-10]RPK85063.1 hypothetical protein EES46_23255 [Streptomyces sp. ADI98-10]
MTDQPPRIPQAEPQEARCRAEDELAAKEPDVSLAVAWALLAVAGELHAIRRRMK